MAPARSCLPFHSHEARGRLLAVWALFRLALSHFHYSCSCTVVAEPAPEELTAVDFLFTSCSNRQDTTVTLTNVSYTRVNIGTQL